MVGMGMKNRIVLKILITHRTREPMAEVVEDGVEEGVGVVGQQVQEATELGVR